MGAKSADKAASQNAKNVTDIVKYCIRNQIIET